MPQPPSRAGAGAAAGAAAAGVAPAAVGAGVAAGGAAAAVGGSIAAGAIMAALINFLVKLRATNRAWLLHHAGRWSKSRDDIAEVVAEEGRLEEAFARASADRLASALPQALAISDAGERAAAVRRLMDAELRYAQQRSEAMAARAIAALTRFQLRRDSPLGAWWLKGLAKDPTPGCLFMAGGDVGSARFWPWAVLDRVHPPRHYGCPDSLHSFGEGVANGWGGAGSVPDTRAAIRMAAGVVMEQEEADALLAEVDVRERLVEAGVDAGELALMPWIGLVEAFDDAEHPRGWHGRFRAVGEVAKGITDSMFAWRKAGDLDTTDAPPYQQIVGNWTKQVRGRLSKDRVAIGMVAAAGRENAANPRWQTVTRGLPADHVIVTKEPRAPRVTSTLLATGHEAASRKADTTVIDENAVKAVGLRGTGKLPSDHPAATSGYGLAALLRHEYGHSIDSILPRDVRRRILDQIPNAEKDLTYYAGTGDQEVIPELLATITHPDYRSADWPQSVQNAERELLKALEDRRMGRSRLRR